MEQTQNLQTRVYGRRKGRPLRVRKSLLIQELLPRLRIGLPAEGKLTPQDIFKTAMPAPAILEVGFGGGEHLAAQAQRYPDRQFIGCEPFINGVASLLDHLERGQIENVRIFDDDARRLLDALQDRCIDQAYVLFADPWPKKRHAERRFIGPENLARFARVLKPGGILRIASDHVSLIEWMRECLESDPRFICVYASDTPPPDWIQTRYQEKALAAGRQPFFMDYKKI